MRTAQAHTKLMIICADARAAHITKSNRQCSHTHTHTVLNCNYTTVVVVVVVVVKKIL